MQRKRVSEIGGTGLQALAIHRESREFLDAAMSPQSPFGAGFRAGVDATSGLVAQERLEQLASLAVAASILLKGTGPKARS